MDREYRQRSSALTRKPQKSHVGPHVLMWDLSDYKCNHLLSTSFFYALADDDEDC